MKNIYKTLIFISVLAILILPSMAFAGIVPPCGNTDVPIGPPDPTTGVVPTRTDCIWGWAQLLLLINNLIDFIFKFLVMPIAAIMFAWAGLLLVTSGGSESRATEAKTIFTNVVIGLVIAAAAWLIINTLLSIFSAANTWSWIGFN